MAININTLKALSIISNKESFEEKSLLTLGRQNISFKYSQIKKNFSNVKYLTGIERDDIKDEFADFFFRKIGFGIVETLDYSRFEGASIIHDLNIPVRSEHYNKYDMLIDGGTLEHVFNFPVAIKSCMNLIKVNGYLVLVTPANNLFGHGFYQFSPELFFRLFSEENGFQVVSMFVNGKAEGSWYCVKDAQEVGERVVLLNDFPTELVVIAKKISDLNIVKSVPQQSDYKTLWNKSLIGEQKKQESSLKKYYKKYIPKKFRDYLWLSRHQKRDFNLGFYRKTHFKRLI